MISKPGFQDLGIQDELLHPIDSCTLGKDGRVSRWSSIITPFLAHGLLYHRTLVGVAAVFSWKSSTLHWVEIETDSGFVDFFD